MEKKQPVLVFLMILDFQRETYDTFYKHKLSSL
jgi:hypothetical protein